MRLHNVSDITGIRTDVNPGTSALFGVLYLGDYTELVVHTLAEADSLIAATAGLKRKMECALSGWRHPFQPDAHRNCGRCGMLPGDAIHAEPQPLAISDETIAQARAFEQPGNTMDDLLAAHDGDDPLPACAGCGHREEVHLRDPGDAPIATGECVYVLPSSGQPCHCGAYALPQDPREAPGPCTVPGCAHAKGSHWEHAEPDGPRVGCAILGCTCMAYAAAACCDAERDGRRCKLAPHDGGEHDCDGWRWSDVAYSMPHRHYEAVRVGVPERIPTPASHYCDSGNCHVCGDGTGDGYDDVTARDARREELHVATGMRFTP